MGNTDIWQQPAVDFNQGIDLEHFQFIRLRPAPPPGHPRDRMLWVAGWGSGPEPNELETR